MYNGGTGLQILGTSAARFNIYIMLYKDKIWFTIASSWLAIQISRWVYLCTSLFLFLLLPVA